MASRPLAQLTKDIFAFGEGAIAYIYPYRAPLVAMGGKFALGLEIGVQLRAEWHQETIGSGRSVYVPGDIHTLNHGELYARHDIPTPDATGLNVGFILHPDGFASGERIARLTPTEYRRGEW
ncbi:MAG TPA: hypothetical protein VNO21_23580 [Polyangiaceae bacterium]|nr:hypothetical protein [Polyangiaceae bacterium]